MLGKVAHPRRVSRLLWLVASCVLACGEADGGSNGERPDEQADGSVDAVDAGDAEGLVLVLEPASSDVRVAPGATFDIPLQVFLRDGNAAPVAVPAKLSASGDPVGRLVDSTFKVTATESGTATVTASYEQLRATASIRVTVSDLLVALDDLAPALADAIGAAGDAPELAPSWLYPESDVLMPPNVHGIELAWEGSNATDAYMLELSNARGRVRVLSKASRVTLERAIWDNAMNVLGAGAITAKVSGVAAGDPSRAGRATRTFRASEASLKGALYYWAAANAYQEPFGGSSDDTQALRGYFRYDFTAPTEGMGASLFLGFARAGQQCVGCHALSTDGKKFATSFGGDKNWGIVDVASSADPLPYDIGGPDDANAKGNFSAFTPSGKHLLVTDGPSLRAFDVQSGGSANQVASFDNSSFSPMTAQIAVSPSDGATVVYVEDLGGGGATRVKRGRLVQIRWNAQTLAFEDRTVLLEDTTSTYSYYYPAISPRGDWLLFNRGKVGSSLSSYENETGEIWALRLGVSGAMPVSLARTNLTQNLTNSWPRWAPFPADDGEGNSRYYLTFSSTRKYIGSGTRTQLWIAGFDPDVDPDEDPSSPAMWLPMQNFTTGNHAAQWTEVFVPPIF